MAHSIAEMRIQNPMWYFERNYAGMMELIRELGLLQTDSAQFDQHNSRVNVAVKERTRYTLLLDIEQLFSRNSVFIKDLMLKVRVYRDVALAEVVAYQGHHQLQPRYDYPNELMLHPDEKRQANLLLHDWISGWNRYRQLAAIPSQ